MSGAAQGSHLSVTQLRSSVLDGQSPFALILGCADSRVPTETIFDQRLGDLFVVRTAGHAVGDVVLGSVEYAVSVVDVDLIVVLGHQGCGAIAAAVDALDGATMPGGHIRSLVEPLLDEITHARELGPTTPDDLVRYHAAATAELLLQRSTVVREAVDRGKVGVVAATYDLRSGCVRTVSPVGTDDRHEFAPRNDTPRQVAFTDAPA